MGSTISTLIFSERVRVELQTSVRYAFFVLRKFGPKYYINAVLQQVLFWFGFFCTSRMISP